MTALQTHELNGVTTTHSRTFTFNLPTPGDRALLSFITLCPHTTTPLKPNNHEILLTLSKINNLQSNNHLHLSESIDPTRLNSRAFLIRCTQKITTIITCAVIPSKHNAHRPPTDTELTTTFYAAAQTHIHTFNT